MKPSSKLSLISKRVNGTEPQFEPFDARRLLPDGIDIGSAAAEYFASVPHSTIEAERFIILSGRDIYDQNKEAVPCCYTYPFGFIGIATDISGNTFAVDVTTGEVLLISHEKYEADGIHPGWNADSTALLPTKDTSRESIIETAEEKWGSVAEFLDDCIYDLES